MRNTYEKISNKFSEAEKLLSTTEQHIKFESLKLEYENFKNTSDILEIMHDRNRMFKR